MDRQARTKPVAASDAARRNLSVGNNAPADNTAPTAVASPAPNAAGWNNTNVAINLNSTDSEPGGTGVKQIQWLLAGAQMGSSTVPGSTTSVTVSTEGITTLTYSASTTSATLKR